MRLEYRYSDQDLLALYSYGHPIQYRLLVLLAAVMATLPPALISGYRGYEQPGLGIFALERKGLLPTAKPEPTQLPVETGNPYQPPQELSDTRSNLTEERKEGV